MIVLNATLSKLFCAVPTDVTHCNWWRSMDEFMVAFGAAHGAFLDTVPLTPNVGKVENCSKQWEAFLGALVEDGVTLQFVDGGDSLLLRKHLNSLTYILFFAEWCGDESEYLVHQSEFFALDDKLLGVLALRHRYADKLPMRATRLGTSYEIASTIATLDKTA